MPDNSQGRTPDRADDSCFDCCFLCMEDDTKFVYGSQKVWPGVKMLDESDARRVLLASALAQVCGQLHIGIGFVMSGHQVWDEVRRLL